MKVVVEETKEEGLDAFLGKPIAVWCLNYIYTGVLVGVNDTCVKLKDAQIVSETGPFNEKGWSDAQSLPGDFHYIQNSSIESFGGVK